MSLSKETQQASKMLLESELFMKFLLVIVLFWRGMSHMEYFNGEYISVSACTNLALCWP
jgi:hypothetical protein